MKSNIWRSQETLAPEDSLLRTAPIYIVKMSMDGPYRYGHWVHVYFWHKKAGTSMLKILINKYLKTFPPEFLPLCDPTGIVSSAAFRRTWMEVRCNGIRETGSPKPLLQWPLKWACGEARPGQVVVNWLKVWFLCSWWTICNCWSVLVCKHHGAIQQITAFQRPSINMADNIFMRVCWKWQKK